MTVKKHFFVQYKKNKLRSRLANTGKFSILKYFNDYRTYTHITYIFCADFETIITSVEMDRVLGKSKRMILPEVCLHISKLLSHPWRWTVFWERASEWYCPRFVCIHILKLLSHPWRWTGSWARASEWYCPRFVYTISFLNLIILIFKRFAAVSVFNSSLSKSFCSIKAVLRIRQKDFIHADPDLTHNLKTLLKTSKFIIMYASSTGKVVTET